MYGNKKPMISSKFFLKKQEISLTVCYGKQKTKLRIYQKYQKAPKGPPIYDEILLSNMYDLCSLYRFTQTRSSQSARKVEPGSINNYKQSSL